MALPEVIRGLLKRRREPARRRARPRAAAWPRASACLGGLRLLARASRARCRTRLRFTAAQCTGSHPQQAALGADGAWRGFCPCCKRPIEVALVDPPRAPRPGAAAGRYAYVAVLWGAKAEYCLGAMVLAKSLREAGCRHDLVLLHTEEMPAAAVELMASAGWRPREVEAVRGVRSLYGHGEPRFECVFTKLHALALTEYEKVLLLDIDTLALQSLDGLFGLPAPAAMARGPNHGYRHGDAIEGRYFFAGASRSKSWGQRSGINAGVMLLQPDAGELERMLQEVLDSNHPSHIRGNGPEQDYLSRYWADSWTHIGVEYNFQLHQLFYSLHPDYVHSGDRSQFLMEPVGAGIRLLHYSGSLKPWSRYLDPEYASSASAEGDARFLRANLESIPGYWLWVLHDKETWDQCGEKEGFGLGSDGRIRRIDWWGTYGGAGGGQPAAAGGAGPMQEEQEAKGAQSGSRFPLGEAVEVPEAAVRGAEQLVEQSLTRWREAYASLSAELGLSSLVGPASLAGRLQAAINPPPEQGTDSQDAAGQVDAVGWRNVKGWWADLPVRERASAVVGCIAERFVTLSFNCQAVVHARGNEALGAHVVVVPADGPAEGLSNGDIAGFVKRAPQDALVLVALVQLAPAALLETLKALADAGCGVPRAEPPAGCGALVAIGQKGANGWHQTMAAADFAIATAARDGGRSAWTAAN